MILSQFLIDLTGFSRRNALAVVLGTFVLAGLGAWWSATHLGVNTDVDAMFTSKLDWRQRQAAQSRDFPQFQDLLVAVIEADAPEAGDATAAELAAALAGNPAIRSVRRPDADPYLTRVGLLFLDKAELAKVLDQTIDAQPFLGQLVADPSARGLFAALALLGLGLTKGEADVTPFLPSLDAFHRAMAGALAGQAQPLSWARLLGGKLTELAGKYRFVLIQPKLDFNSLEPGGAGGAAVRAAIENLEFVRSGQARVRVTGSVALADEECATVAEGAVEGVLISVALITLWLFLAVRSWRLIVPILLTLGVGLAFTLTFAALAVGTLNLVSVGFGILFVGIAVDFAIQFGVRYREARAAFGDPAEAMRVLTARAGGQILIAAATTAAGFLAFVPTDFAGVAELGLIAGVGMLIAFACTLGFLPAAITLFRPHPEPAEVGFWWGRWADVALVRARRPVLAVFAALAALGVALIPSIQFDSDPLNTKNPNTEAMRTLRDLMSSPLSNPYSIDIMAPNPDAAALLATRLRALPLVSFVITLDSLVPKDQPVKLELIADAASILGPSLTPRSPAAPVTAADIRMAAHTALGPLEEAARKLPADHPVIAITADLRAMAAAPDDRLLATNAVLTRHLPAQIAQLRAALAASPVTRTDVPPSLARDWLTPDGRVRVQVVAKPEARDSRGLHALVEQVRTITPDPGGSAVIITATADTIIGAFRSATIWALASIAVLLGLALRRVTDTLLVLAPLAMSALLTVGAIVLGGLQLNFANIIALPLLLGLGVSFNIYFVLNWRAGRKGVLGTATARAILFSALTTASAFGTLAASRHPGTASMGVLLLISLGCTLLASLVFIPALLASVRTPKS